MVSDSIPLILAKFQPAVLHCEVSRTLTVSLVLPVSSDVAEVVEETADNETVLGDISGHSLCNLKGLECVVSHTAGILVVAVALDSKEVTAFKKGNQVLDPISIG